MSQFIDEGLKREAKCVATRCPHRAGRNAEWEQAVPEIEIGDEFSGELIAANTGRCRNSLALAERDEVILPGNEFAGSIDPTFQKVEAARTENLEAHLVFARPPELDGHAHLLCDVRRFDDVVVVETTAETAAHLEEVERDVLGRDGHFVLHRGIEDVDGHGAVVGVRPFGVILFLADLDDMPAIGPVRM